MAGKWAAGAYLPCRKVNRRGCGGWEAILLRFSLLNEAINIPGCWLLIAESGPFIMIAIGSDHGGVELKDFLLEKLRSKGLEVEDLGTKGEIGRASCRERVYVLV